MEGIDRLSATLNKEHRTIGAAIDAIGPAVKVLNQQHQALVTMLRSLDKLGQVGTRVIRQSRENLVATLRHLAPALRELADAGGSLPRGLGLMASFPFPKEAADLAKGDYANAAFFMKLDLNKLFGTGGYGNSSNIPSPVEVCMVTPAKPLCKNLSEGLLNQLCSLMPTNPLCPGVGPPPNGGGTLPSVPGLGDLGGLLGLQSSGTPKASTTTTQQPGLLDLLLGGGS